MSHVGTNVPCGDCPYLGQWKDPVTGAFLQGGGLFLLRAYATPKACLAAIRANVAVRPALMPVKLLG